MRPNISAMMSHEQGNISDQPDSFGCAISLQLFPLHGKLPLDKFMISDVIRKAFLRAKHGIWLAGSQV